MHKRKHSITKYTLKQIEDKLKRLTKIVEIARNGPVDKYQIQKILAEQYQITVGAGTINVDFAILLRAKVQVIEKTKGRGGVQFVTTVLEGEFSTDMLTDTIPRITISKQEGAVYSAPKLSGLEYLFGYTDFLPPENAGRFVEERHPYAGLIPFKNGVSGTSLSVESMSVVR